MKNKMNLKLIINKKYKKIKLIKVNKQINTLKSKISRFIFLLI